MPLVRAYEELNERLAPELRKRDFAVDLPAGATVARLLAVLGIPDESVDLVLVDGASAGLDDSLDGVGRVALYPVFERFALAGVTRVRERPLRRPRFLADEHLARLARCLRLAGFDTHLAAGLDDVALVELGEREARIVLTRDRRLLEELRPSRAVYVASQRPREQFVLLVTALQLEDLALPFTLCMVCNSTLMPAPPETVVARVPASVRREHAAFRSCPGCGRVYWAGGHYRRMLALLSAAGIRAGPPPGPN